MAVKKLPPGTHRCPGPCGNRVVPDSLYCCPDDWQMLPERARKWITQTAHKGVLEPERRAAIEFARRMWRLATLPSLDTLQSRQ